MRPLETPVVLCLFNRPDLTARVFQAVRRARPTRLFLVADGPRPDQPDDPDACAAARRAVEQVDWDCRVSTDFSDVNLGDGLRIATGLDAVFAAADEAIVLEDDTLPDDSFFGYCAELLHRWRDDPSVMMVSGYNGLRSWSADADASYLFTRYGSVWGWATWRRAWLAYDFTLQEYRAWDAADRLAQTIADPDQAAHLTWLFSSVLRRPVNKWDVQWTLICALRGGLCAVPTVNLVRNLGFGARGTHTRAVDDPRDVPQASLPLPLKHPASAPGTCVDDRFERWQYWLHLVAKYRDFPRLRSFGRALARHPEVRLPPSTDGAAFSLAPLRRPREALRLLDHVRAGLPSGRRIGELMELFRALAAADGGER